MSPDKDDFQDDDEQDDFASRSIYSAGWFRAVLVLTVLAIVVVISLPYLLNWFEPAPPVRSQSAESPPPVPSPTAPPRIAPPAPPPAPAAPIAAAPEVKPSAPVSPPPKAAVAPPPAPKAVAESKAIPSATSAPARKTAADSAPAKRTEEAPANTASKRPAVTRVVAKGDGPSPSSVGTIKPSAAPSGSYWVQLGAFKDQKNADALAKSVRDAGFPVQVSSPSRGNGGESTGGAQQHELFVTGASPEKVNAALKGRGKAQAVAGGVAVKPPFSLQEAVTMSKRLSDQGLAVVIRPAGGLAMASQSPGTLHAVRAGGYSNRASALAARNQLAAKGHPGFVSEGSAK